MKRLIFILFFTFSSLSYGGEQIIEFNSDIFISRDASIHITETLTVNVLGDAIKRGIVREIPTIYKDKLGKKINLNFKLLSVKQNNAAVNHRVVEKNNGVTIYIGSKNVYLKPGIYSYEIQYQVNNAIGYFKEFDELYWNVTGTGWRFPIISAKATLQIEGNADFTQYEAYTGAAGSREKNVSAEKAVGKLSFITTAVLPARAGLTIAAAFPKGSVVEPSAADRLAEDIKQNLHLYLIFFIFISQILYYVFSWWHVGRGPKHGTIVPLFAPPSGLSPAAMRYLKKLRYDTKAYTAAIINMGVKGYLKISENADKSIDLDQQAIDIKNLSGGEAKIASGLFKAGDSFSVSQKNHSTLSSNQKAHEKSLAAELQKTYFISNSVYLIPGILLTLLSFLVMGLAVWNGDETPIIFFYIPFVAAGIGLLYQSFQTKQYRNLLAVVFIAFILGTHFYALGRHSAIEIFMLSSIVGLNIIFHQLLKAHTLKGRRLMDQIDGFTLYLEKAEKYRLKQAKPDNDNIALFEKYLPYAVALDVEDAWTQNFDSQLQKALKDQPDRLSWYHSSSPGFRTPSAIVTGLGAGFVSSIASASAAPGSSSGSGGGGFSGGGGGGGGGGGW